MDDLRRKFLLSSGALAGSVLLPGCGGGGDQADPSAVAPTGGRASAQSVAPLNVSYLSFSGGDGNFTEPNLQAMLPMANVVQAVYSKSISTLYIRIMETVMALDGVSLHHRSFQLALPGFDPSLTSRQDFNFPSSPAMGYRGSVVDMVLKGSALTRYEYEFWNDGTGTREAPGLIYATAVAPNTVKLDCLAVNATAKQFNVFSAPQAAVALDVGSNAAVNPVFVTTRIQANQTSNPRSTLALNFAVESGSWI